METTKNCSSCGKLMHKEDYEIYNNYPISAWNRRKYCSKNCERISNSKKNYYKKKIANMDLEHNQFIVSVQKLLGGEIKGINSTTFNGYIPDIETQDSQIEVENIGSAIFRNKQHYREIKNKKRILVMCPSKRLNELFDEIYFSGYNIKKL